MLVSAIIPTFNYGQYVVEAVESALSQTWPNMEVIVVDDGSTDDTRQRLTPYMDRIEYICQTNAGLSAARNTGIRKAKGEWVGLLDSDDVWHPEKTKAQFSAVGDLSGIGLIGSRESSQMPEKLPTPAPAKAISVRDLLLKLPIGPSGTMIRRECFGKIGQFDTTLRSAEDRDMWLRLAVRFKCVQVRSPCWWYRPHAAQMNRCAFTMYENYSAVLAKFFEQHHEYRPLKSLAYGYLHFDAAWSHLASGHRLTAIQHLLRSYLTCPRFADPDPDRRWIRTKLLARAIFGTDVLCSVGAALKRSRRAPCAAP